MALIGLSLGLIRAYFVGRGMQSALFGISPIDLSALGTVWLVLLLAALLACFIPARCAASMNPMQALKTD